ncbi:HNH endonuclease signature motif containing protein [Kutzneria sp. 744]|uniref:HNH endonuclease signature motif containing protein n=1 Tax=Kutzneria sp. (strain 744) TaxID=345341 RepID=UPI0004B7BC75|nr:HNH endonuclease signature motif containing protein [Kutzneria sp. 744]
MVLHWRLTIREARERLRYAELFHSEALREAGRAGELDRQHLKIIHETLRTAPAVERDRVEASLLENVQFDEGEFKNIAQRILFHLNQDGKAPDDRELRAPKREFRFERKLDGSMVFWGMLDQEYGAKIAAMVSALAKPTSGKDPRTTAERQGDAFAEIIELASRSEGLPEQGGERPHLTLSMSFKDFMDNTGVAKVEGGGVMSAAEARRIACDSTVMRMVLGANEEILNVGRQQRTAPKGIRKALIERDGTCAFPGCATEPARCHAHHVVEWANGGPTSLDNMVLLCGSHHRLIHHSRWTVTMVDQRPVFSDGLGETG